MLNGKANQTSLQDLQAASRSLGRKLGVFKCTPKLIDEIPLPVLVYLESDEVSGGSLQLLVDIDDSTNSYVLLDPALAIFHDHPKDKFLRQWSGFVLAEAPEKDGLRWVWFAVCLFLSAVFLVRLKGDV